MENHVKSQIDKTESNVVSQIPKKSGVKTAAVIIGVTAVLAVTAVLFILAYKNNVDGNADSKVIQMTTADMTKTTQDANALNSPDRPATTDPEEIAKRIEVYGNTVSLPCKVRDMKNVFGESWEVAKPSKGEEKFYTLSFLKTDSSDKFVNFFLDDYNDKDDSIIKCSIFWYSYMRSDYINNYNVDGVDGMTTFKQLKEKYGDALKHSENAKYLYYIKNDKAKVTYSFRKSQADADIRDDDYIVRITVMVDWHH